jgi:hypothetical protein
MGHFKDILSECCKIIPSKNKKSLTQDEMLAITLITWKLPNDEDFSYNFYFWLNGCFRQRSSSKARQQQ